MQLRVFGEVTINDEKFFRLVEDVDGARLRLQEVDSNGRLILGGAILCIDEGGIHLYGGYEGSLPHSVSGHVNLTYDK